MKTIITPLEVIRNSPLRNDFPANELLQAIHRYEKIFFVDCFKELYQSMIDDIIDYDYVCYDKSTVYGINEIVLYNGILYQSLENNNSTVPKQGVKWIEPSKFQDSELENIWHEALKYILSYNVVLRVITHITMQAGSKGLVVFTEDESNIKGASNKDIIEFKRELNFGINEYLIIFNNLVMDSNSHIFAVCKTSCVKTNININVNRRLMIR